MALGFGCDHGPEMQEWDRWVEELLKRKKSKSAARSPRFPASSERFQSMLSLARVGSFIAAKNPIFAFPSPTCLAASFFTTDAFMHLRGPPRHPTEILRNGSDPRDRRRFLLLLYSALFADLSQFGV
jgi:hypothetical protein